MSKCIKVTGINGEKFLLPVHEIELICPDADHGNVFGSKILRYRKERVLVKETVDQIEDQLLLDEFAKSALSGILANSSVDNLEAKDVSHDSFIFAEAMLKERSK